MADNKDQKKKDFKKRLADDMKAARKDYKPKITQGEAATRLKISKQHASNLETGKYFPTVDYMYELSQLTGKELIIIFR